MLCETTVRAIWGYCMGPLAIVCGIVGEESWSRMIREQDDTERYANGEEQTYSIRQSTRERECRNRRWAGHGGLALETANRFRGNITSFSMAIKVKNTVSVQRRALKGIVPWRDGTLIKRTSWVIV